MPELFLIDGDNNLTPLSHAEYDSESLLQKLLADHPALLGGDQMGSGAPRQWLFVAREAAVPDSESGTARWSLDHLFLDQDAILTFVEVKRASDSRIRREVVGQMLDYAANGLRHWPLEQIQSFVAKQYGDIDAALTQAFGEAVDSAAYWQQLGQNMSDGRVRLLFVADQIPQELLAVVEFLNKQMDHTEVLAVEIPQFTGEGIRTLAPRVLGQTQEAVQRKGAAAPGSRWDEDRFFNELAAIRSADEVAFARKYLDWERAQGHPIVWGTGKTNGSFGARYPVGNRQYVPVVCYMQPGIEFELYYMQSWPPFDGLEMRREFVRRLNRIPGANIPEDDNTLMNKRPTVPHAVLAQTDAFELLTEALEWFKTEAEKAAASPGAL